MSAYMLNDEDAINDVNPFVLRDFSLPGGVRQTGDFKDFKEVPPSPGISEAGKSVYCEYALCKDEKNPCFIEKPVHPRRNVDCGFTGRKEREAAGTPRGGKSGWGLESIILMVLILSLLLFAVR
jgi:hypothetical protein